MFILTVFVFVCRYPDAGAAAHPWHQQEDDRGPQGLLRILGEGTDQAQYSQRSVLA